MAFSRTANAVVVHPRTTPAGWSKIRAAKVTSGQPAPNLVAQATEILGQPFDPSKYLLTHCTIVASVDVTEVPNVKLGSVKENGKKINRKYADYRVTAETDKLLNNNLDGFPRDVLLKSYRTFVGGHNFCFAPGTGVMLADGTYRAIEDIKIGDDVITHTGGVQKVTHTFVREYEGPIQAIHVDRFQDPILATGNHPFRAISVEAPPLMGYAGSKVSSKARYRKDQITSALRDGHHHFGSAQPAVRAVREFIMEHGPSLAGDIAEGLGHNRNYGPVILRRVLKRHGDVFECRPLQDGEHASLTKGRSRIRVWSVCEDAPLVAESEVRAEKSWMAASTLTPGMFLLGAERRMGSTANRDRATLLGYYLAEGCRLTPHKDYGVALCFGAHERHLVEHAAHLAEKSFPGTRASIQKPSNGGLRVNLYGAGIDRWMVEHGGVYSESKRLHSSVFSWDQESLLRMLAAWMAGDGDFHTGTLRLRGSTASMDLGEQMQRVAELCGVKSSLVFTRQRIGEVVSQIEMVVGGEPRLFDVIPRHHTWSVVVSKDSTTDVACRTPRWGSTLHDVSAVRKRQNFAWWEDCRVHVVRSNEAIPYKGIVHNLEVAGDNSYVVTHGVAVHNCEHVQIEDLSKGRIIDAVARDIGESVYIDILVATDRKHTELVADIENGRMSTLSMGCSVEETQCTKCGNVAVDETELCECVKYSKGNRFFAEDGKTRRIGELCGHPTIDPNGGVTFIEASWVASPAFTGAVMRNIIMPDAISAKAAKQMQEVLGSPPPQWVSSGNMKAASEAEILIEDAAVVGRVSDRKLAFDFEQDEEAAPAAAPTGGPLDELEDRVMQDVIDRVEKRVREEMDKRPPRAPPEESSAAPNDTIVKEATRKVAREAYSASVKAMSRTASSEADLINKVAVLDAHFGVKVPVVVYRTALAAGSITKHGSVETFLKVCRDTLGRPLSRDEGRAFVRLGQILNSFTPDRSHS